MGGILKIRSPQINSSYNTFNMLQKILLSNFRSFEQKLIEFSPEITIIVGPNAAGKTNIMESIYLLSTGKSFKANVESEMIKQGEEIGRVKGRIVNEEEETLEVVLTHGIITRGSMQERTAKKRLLVNDVGKRLVDFAGRLPVVLFSPLDMELISGSPSTRRKFLDAVLSQVDKEYRRSYLSYDKGLRMRNRLLWQVREEGIPRTQLAFWDRLLIKHGNYMTNARQDFVDFLNVSEQIWDEDMKVIYDRSTISEERLAKYEREEVASATTLVGPHRDDFTIEVSNGSSKRDLATFGSRGEQRMGVLWMKLGELKYIEAKLDQKPTLLLDDIFSELDHDHREIVNKVAKNQQTIITTADEHFIGLNKGTTLHID